MNDQDREDASRQNEGSVQPPHEPPGYGQGPQQPPPGYGQGPQQPPPGYGQGPQQPPPGYQQWPGQSPPAVRQSDDRMWAMFCHLSALVAGVIGPLVIWLIKKDESPFVDAHGKQAVNFQISMLIYAMAAGVLVCLVVGIIALPAVGIVDLIFTIIAAVKANNGEMYRYPLAIQFIR